MKINQHTAVCSSDVILVPYSAHHVPQYHKWMSSAQLRALTASEELTIEEELANQRSWRQDPEKLTFISIDASAWLEKRAAREAALNLSSDLPELLAKVDDDNRVMIGDVNMFFYADGEEEEKVIGEVNIMVAEPSSRGKGFGKKALLLFLWFVTSHRDPLMLEYHSAINMTAPTLSEFVAKIDKDNEVSVRMFEGVGFRRIRGEPNYFGEIELRLEFSLAVRMVKQFFGDTEVMLLRYKSQDEA